MADQMSVELEGAKCKVRINWIDMLKVIAVFVVIITHANDDLLFNQNGDFNRGWGAYIGSFCRFAVPLFVLISGVLLFPVKLDTLTFYKKKLGRIIPPLLFWGIAYVLFDGLVLHHRPAEKIWIDIAGLPLSFGNASPHLWYLYMLAGLYLLVPIVAPWVAKATKRELEVVLAIFIFSTFIPYLKFLTGLAFGMADWNEFHAFYYLSGFIGYLLMGHYLYTYLPGWNNRTKRWTGTFLLITGYGITYYLTLNVPFSILNMEMVWYYCSPNVLLAAVGVFILFAGIEFKAGLLTSTINTIARHAFGIFLIHYFFVGTIFRYLESRFDFHVLVNVLLSAVLTFLISFALVWLLNKARITRKLVM